MPTSREQLLSNLPKEFSAATGDPRALTELVARRLAQLVGDGCALRLLVGGKLEQLGGIHHVNEDVAARSHAAFASAKEGFGQSLSKLVVVDGRSRNLSSPTPAELAAQFPEASRAIILTLEIRSVLAVPLLVGGKVVGVATLARTGGGPAYTLEEQTLVEDVAAHAALAITNARLLADMQAELAERLRAQARLQTLSQFAKDCAAATGDSAQLLELVAQRLGQIVGESCLIRLSQEVGGERHGVLFHPNPEVAKTLRSALVDAAGQPGTGISADVQTTGVATIISGSTEEVIARVHPSFAAALRERGVTSLLSAPLRSGGTVIGAVTMRRSGGAVYTQADLEQVEELLHHASLAIHNSQLLESMQRELTERVRAEEALRRTEEQFRHAQKMQAIGRLAGGVAHDFNNLLSVILTCASLGREELEPEHPGFEEFRQIQIAGQRAADLTRQLLSFSRRQVLNPQVIDLNDMVLETERMVRSVVSEQVRVFAPPARQPIHVKVDPGHLSQVILNLAINARDAMPAGGTLTIDTRHAVVPADAGDSPAELRAGPYAVLSISDTGVGMDDATLERIFEPFFTTKEVGKGTGLGLSTVIGIVEQSGGAVRVRSVIGAGSTFEIYLPCVDSEDSRAEKARVDTTHQALTILLVEDDAQVRRVAERTLERAGHRVLSAAGAAQARLLFDHSRDSIDLLLTDIVMPEGNGYQLAQALQAARPGLHVLYMSGYSDETHKPTPGIDASKQMLTKPLTPELLLTRIRELANRQ